jgi:hypothetical protein
MHRRATIPRASGDATLNTAVTRAQIPVDRCQCQLNKTLPEMDTTHLNHLPPEHAFPALFMQWPKTPSLRHSVNMQHFTSLGSAIAQLLARRRWAVCHILLTIWTIAIRIPPQVFAASTSLLASARSPLRGGQYDCGMAGRSFWLTLCLQAPPILRGSNSGDVFGEDRSSAANARAAKAMTE